jgi:hypothetical protein
MNWLLEKMGLALTIAFGSVLPAIAQTTPNRPTQLDCLVGYPDGTFRGDRALTRYEFVAGMAACLDQQVQQFETKKGGFATKAEVETLLQTQQNLTQEIKQLNERIRLLSDE